MPLNQKPVYYRTPLKAAARVTLDMDLVQAILALGEGNPGAITAMLELVKEAPIVDPQSAFGGFSPLISLDAHGIYGGKIWVLYKEICGQNPARVLTLFRGASLGLIPHDSITDTEASFDFEGLQDRIRKKIGTFNGRD